ncbi:MAG TPA: hypothetical protein VI814_03950 [Candidatus Limnocylindria bacterium]
MPPLPAWLRPWPYLLLGLLVGFLFLAEFALNSVPAVQVALLVLAIAGLAGVVLRVRWLELWPLFVAGAIVIPLIEDSHVVGLPRCDTVAPGVACLAGTRDVVGEFQMDIAILVTALVATVILLTRAMLAPRDMGRR